MKLLPRMGWNIPLLLFFVLVSQQVNGQSRKPDVHWWDSPRYEKDTLAAAVILNDVGECIADANYATRFVHKRTLKILTKDALDEWGDFDITEYARLIDFSATVFNKEGGQIKSATLDITGVSKTKLKKGKYRYTAALPQVKVGSVIQLEYTLKSDYYSLFEWQIQHSIPVVWSEYEIYISYARYFGVEAIVDGMYHLTDVKRLDRDRNMIYRMVNVPAFHAEPMMPNPWLYRSRIRFGMAPTPESTVVYIKNVLASEGMTMDSAMIDTQHVISAKAAINTDGIVSGNVSVSMNGFGAFTQRKLINDDEQKYYSENVDQSLYTILKSETKNLNDKEKDLELYYEFGEVNAAQRTDSLVYIYTKSFFKEDGNPFILETRKYPIDVGSRLDKKTVIELSLPDNYAIEQLPANALIELPDKTASFVISITSINRKIFLTTRLKFRKVIYNAHEYEPLREFFLRVYSKRNEPIVLRRVK